MIGRALTRSLLDKNYRVVILSRSDGDRQETIANLTYARWDTDKQTIDKAAVAKADFIIHLAGAGVAEKRWTKKRKQEIVNSRVKSGELLARTLQEDRGNVKAVITISGIGWYGPDPANPNPHPFTEEDSAANDFLGQTCQQWEASLSSVTGNGIRLTVFRTGVVLSNEGGALPEFQRTLPFGIAAILGSGRQIVSWIHIDDMVRLFTRAIESENMHGVYNAVASHPVSNKDLVLKIAGRKRGRFFVPVYVPSFVLRLVLGEMCVEVLKSATVSSAKLHYDGFTFLYPTLDAALDELLK